MQLRPTKIELEGFRSFRELNVITFPDSGAVLINGFTNDRTTGSGTGKSSILMGIAFALGFCDLPATELKNRYSKKMFVRLTLTDGTNIYEIVRNPKLQLSINGQMYDGLSKGAEEKLNEIIGLSPALTQILTYRPQRSFGTFVNSTDAANKELLSTLLNLGEIEEAGDQFNAQNNELSSQHERAESNLQIINDQINAERPNYDQFDNQIQVIQKTIQETASKIAQLANNDAKTEIMTKIGQIDAKIRNISSMQNDLSNREYQNKNIRSEIEKINKEVETLQSNKCPTCLREWDKTSDLIDQKKSKIKELATVFKTNMESINNAKQTLENSSMDQLQKQRGDFQTELAQLSAPLNQLYQLKHSSEFNLSQLLERKKSFESKLQKVQEIETTKREISVKQHLLSHSSAILGRTGFLGAIFDEVLRDITNKSNDLIAHVPNVSSYTVSISSSTVTKTGKVNKKIDTFLYRDGEKVSFKSLSGGQKTSIELCVDLAVAEVIRARSGSKLGWVALDEAMDALGIETKISMLDAIKGRIKGLIIVVDHSTEIKEAFNSVINVDFDGRDSNVRENNTTG